MQFDFLTVMAYVIVAITIMTMVFGLLAYSVYKIREVKRAKKKANTALEKVQDEEEKIKYLFFEHKEIQL
jgi:heme/copper-type cytochrome/quinol oxidase subunit 2